MAGVNSRIDMGIGTRPCTQYDIDLGRKGQLAGEGAFISRLFHRNTSTVAARHVLYERGRCGSFLLRQSEHNPEEFTISVKCNDGNVIHIRVHSSKGHFHINEGQHFATLTDLFVFYMNNPKQLNPTRWGVTELKYPFYTAPTSARWYHGNISGKETEELLMKSGHNGSYLIRDSQSKPGFGYVMSIRVDDTETMRLTHVHIVCEEGLFYFGLEDSRKFETLSQLLAQYKQSPLVLSTGYVVYLIKPLPCSKFIAANIAARIEELDTTTTDSDLTGFTEEFKDIQLTISPSDGFRDGQQAENKPKNRYQGILPYDHTRVILCDGDPDEAGSDYINASVIRIRDTNGGRVIHDVYRADWREYVAAQGCLPNTIVCFWRMVRQMNSRVVVMVTGHADVQQDKCAVYWPDSVNNMNKFKTHMGILHVKFIKEERGRDFNIKELEVYMEGQRGIEPKKKKVPTATLR